MDAFRKDQFSFKELTMNSNGKQSGSGFIGLIMGLVASVSAVAIVIGWWIGISNAIEMMEKVIQLGLLSAALLGVRKLSGAQIFGKSEQPQQTQQNSTPDSNTQTNQPV